MEMAVSGLREARAILAVTEPLFSGDMISAMMDFEKPSNPVFQPLEYRSTNCCIHRPLYLRAIRRGTPTTPHTPGTPVGDSPISFCSIPAIITAPDLGWPPYERPGLAEIPDPQPDDDDELEMDDLGQYFPGEYATLVLDCVPSTTSGAARLEGDMIGVDNRILYKTTISAVGDCGLGTITTDQKNAVFAHERKHAEAYVGIINSIREDKRLGASYPSMKACKMIRDAMERKFDEDYEKLEDAHGYHTADVFCGEEEWKTTCPEGGDSDTPTIIEPKGTFYGSGDCD